MASIELKNITKTYSNVPVVNNISFKIEEGEILTLLGPSGCGKTTTLRMIAGFIKPDNGLIFFGEKNVTEIAPQNRNTAMVFQSYALWPHLSVEQNIEFGLNVRKIPMGEKKERIKEVLNRVRLYEYKDRMPSQLSGGQQQRIAVARALVINPDVLLLDEPLSNLDAKLRIETRQEIRDLVKSLGLTTIFVTHDQSEALSISDKIAVMELGNLRQIGSPDKIWLNPDSAFVGSFIGEANTIDFTVTDVSSENVTLQLPELVEKNVQEKISSSYFRGITDKGQLARAVIRPETIHVLDTKPQTPYFLNAKIHSFMFFGTYTFVQAELSNNKLVNIHAPSDIEVHVDQEVFLEIKPKNIKTFGPNNY